MSGWASLDWESIFKGLAVAVGAIASIIQVRSLIPPSRARLRADLEILKLLDASDEAAPLVRAHTMQTIRRLYGQGERPSRFTVYNWSDLILGLILLPVFSVWTVYLIEGRHYWWTLLTGLMAFAGTGCVMNGFDPKRAKPKPPASDTQSAPVG